MKFTPENLSRVLQRHPTILPATVRTWRKRGVIPDKYMEERLPLLSFLTDTQIAGARRACEKYSMDPEQWRVHTINKQSYKVYNFDGNAVAELDHLLNTPTRVGQNDVFYVKCLMSHVAAIKKKYKRNVIIV